MNNLNFQINARFSTKKLSSSDYVDTYEVQPYQTRLPQVYLAFQMDQLKINSNKEKLLYLNKLKLDAKVRISNNLIFQNSKF